MDFSPFSDSFSIRSLKASAFTLPTDFPESDGTLMWDSTTMVLVEATAGGKSGIGYSYGDRCLTELIQQKLAPLVQGWDAMDVPGAWEAMVHAIRNNGRPGLCSMAIAAVDSALWDLKARLLDMPLAKLLGMTRPSVPVYGSGGFTSYSDSQLRDQLGGWVQDGISRVKMKIGREPGQDAARVRAAREAIGSNAELFVDANGAYTRKQALRMADMFAESNVTWLEEPVSSDDLEGLHLIRDRGPAGMAIAAGEYGYDLPYFRRMLEAGAVDVLQADATRCAGITGFLQVAALAAAWGLPFSAHTSPSLHLHPCCAVPNMHSIEYFHDHVRIESRLFDGFVTPVNGQLIPDLSRPGVGLELKRADAARYAA
jgi:L-alanine-DL-glutamate epimerase-like enolase superfamily enzyme